MSFRLVSLAALAACLGACSSHASTSPTKTGDAGATPVPIPAAAPVSNAELVAFGHVTNLTPLVVGVGKASGWGIVDTGNPVVELSPAIFGIANDTQAMVTLVVGGKSYANVDALGTTLGFQTLDPAIPFQANVGCGLLCGRVASIDYQGVGFSLGASVPKAPSSVAGDVAVPFTLGGGKVAPTASHILVPVSIEGKTYTLQVDTGATEVTVSAAVYAALTSDGRTQFTGSSTTSNGSGATSLTRAHSIVVGGAEVDAVVVAHSDDFDTTLANVAKDVGSTVDGSLGVTFLNHFFVSIDYPNSVLHLEEYADTSFVVDPARTTGIALAPVAGGGYEVAEVLPSSDAVGKGVSVGDVVVAIDGTTLAPLGYSQALILCFGSAGSSRSFQFGTAQNVSHKTVSIDVIDLLPLSGAADAGSDGGGDGATSQDAGDSIDAAANDAGSKDAAHAG